MSMCRDLIFHVKEHRYNLNQIDNILSSLKLSFHGFVLSQDIKTKYAHQYCNDYSQTNLRTWSKFEEENPTIFRAMYQFWISLMT